MDQQQQEFHDRIAELLRRTERLHQAAKELAESFNVDTQHEEVFTTVGATDTDQDVQVEAEVSAPEHGDALAADYAEEPVETGEPEQDPRERAEEALQEVQDAAEDVSEIVDGINIDDLLDGIDLDDGLQQ